MSFRNLSCKLSHQSRLGNRSKFQVISNINNSNFIYHDLKSISTLRQWSIQYAKRTSSILSPIANSNLQNNTINHNVNQSFIKVCFAFNFSVNFAFFLSPKIREISRNFAHFAEPEIFCSNIRLCLIYSQFLFDFFPTKR